MKAKNEKIAIQFVVSALAAELTKTMFDEGQKVSIEGVAYPTKSIARALADKKLDYARQHLSEPEYDRILKIKNIMQDLAEKLLHCESDEMLNVVTMAIHAINTGQMYIADENQELIEA